MKDASAQGSAEMKNNGKPNYDKELQLILSELKTTPELLLHSCCAPCSSYVLEYLSEYFKITVFYFNPNIYPEEEFYKRANEQEKLIKLMGCKNNVSLITADYQPERFNKAVKGFENNAEGGERCFACYRLRLEETAMMAEKHGFDYFTTTLSVSPYKNAPKLNEISRELGEIYKVKSLPSDFKKLNGYKRSVQLSEEYGLYRQNYCGCVFSYNSKGKLDNIQ